MKILITGGTGQLGKALISSRPKNVNLLGVCGSSVSYFFDYYEMLQN